MTTTTTTTTTTPDASHDPTVLRECAASVSPATPQQRNVSLAFDRLAEHWGDHSAHQAFVYEASRASELTFAGKLYRAVLERWPDDEMTLAAQKQIATSAMFAGPIGLRSGTNVPKFPRWVFLSGGMSLAWIVMDLATEGTFSPVDLLMVLICFGSLGYAVYKVRN